MWYFLREAHDCWPSDVHRKTVFCGHVCARLQPPTITNAPVSCPPPPATLSSVLVRDQLVDDSGGFRTFSSRVPGSSSLSLRGETIVDEHIGRLYTAFLNTTSTLDWVRFLVEVEELPVAAPSRGGGGARGTG